MTSNTSGITYKEAGVDIDRGNRLVERIRPLAAATQRAGVMGSLGGFGSLFNLAETGYRDPILVAATDGVGTKLKLATALNKHDTIGIDLVAMSVNDLIVQGAEPLFFLDYFASSALDLDVAEAVVKGIARGCRLAGAALVGGETAEMPDMYAPGEYDLAGFCVGVVEADQIIDGSKVEIGDAVIGLAASGLHSNGYSLVRKLLERTGATLADEFSGRTLGEVLLEPTRIYVKALLELRQSLPVHAAAHITGGGLVENVPRVLPAGTAAHIDGSAWSWPPIFNWLQDRGQISDQEMFRTFNCGVGMVIVVPATASDKALEALRECGETAWLLGNVKTNRGNAVEIVNRP